MKKWSEEGKRIRYRIESIAAAAGVAAAVTVSGCGAGNTAPETDVRQQEAAGTNGEEQIGGGENDIRNDAAETDGTGMGSTDRNETERDGMGGSSAILQESARDAEVDFGAVKAENPEIFGWLYLPETSIDAPVLQSMESDDYYETHNALKENDDGGALYIEAANLASMCDFNTVIHGKTLGDGGGGVFDGLYQFADPDYFDSHEQMYLYLEDNVLTYEIFAAYERDNTSLIRTYDFTYVSGCEQFLNDLYATRSMNMMIRSGWEDVTPYHFLVTLTTCREENPEKQFVVVAALIEDPAGTIDRVIVE